MAYEVLFQIHNARFHNSIHYKASMVSIYLANDNNDPVGPFTTREVEAMLVQGTVLPGTLSWHADLVNWLPLRTAFPELCPAPPPLAHSLHRNLSTTEAKVVPLGITDGFWISFVLAWSVGGSLKFAIDATMLTTPELAFIPLILFVPIYITICLLTGWIHYRLWSAIPKAFQATTPAKAVGFLFIPLFNIYWIYATLTKLSESLMAWSKTTASPVKKSIKHLAIASAVTTYLSGPLGGFSLLGTLVFASQACAIILFYHHAIKAINALQSAEVRRST